MKSKYLIIVLLFTLLIPTVKTFAQETADKQQRITTPPLQLSEEEKKSPETKEPSGPSAKGQVKSFLDKEAESIRAQTGEASTLAPVKTKSRIELVLDASGSMNGIMGSTTKMAMLKSAVNDIVSQPAPGDDTQREIGLRVYGNQRPAEDNFCEDTELVLPIEPVDVNEFTSKINSITAMGVTPIGSALRDAEKDFTVSEDADNIIILVTDGADSCNADICKIAADIHNGPKKVIVNVLGFDIDANAKDSLQCITSASDGQFTTARNENELISSLDQMMMANIQYNLRVKVLSGASPLKSNIKVYRGGSKRLVREDQTSGIKYYQLPPGSYDIEVTFEDSIETPHPSKMIRGVEVQATSKAEQVVQFDMGMLTLAAYDQDGAPIEANYFLTNAADPKVAATFKSEALPKTIFLTEGSYNVKVSAVTGDGLALSATADNLKITKGQTATHDFQFEVGRLKLAGVDSAGDAVPIAYKISPVTDNQLKAMKIIEGTTPADGKFIDLPPGKYNIEVGLQVEGIADLPMIELEDFEIGGRELLVKQVEIPSSVLTLIGKDDQGRPTETLFTLRVNGSDKAPAELTYTAEPITLMLPPGRYDIRALFVNSEFDPKPLISWEAIPLVDGQTLEQTAEFKFGTLKLAGQNSKGAPLNTTFYIYRVGENEPLVTLSNILSPTNVKLTEGFYDIQATDLTARSDPKPNVWFHNIEVRGTEPIIRTAVFTNGILKMICKGPNNTKLVCDYRVFTYGTDSPLYEGTTTENWKEFDILPGNYYIEAGYHDEVDEVLLKKWITFGVDDNEMVEQIIRF